MNYNRSVRCLNIVILMSSVIVGEFSIDKQTLDLMCPQSSLTSLTCFLETKTWLTLQLFSKATVCVECYLVTTAAIRLQLVELVTARVDTKLIRLTTEPAKVGLVKKLFALKKLRKVLYCVFLFRKEIFTSNLTHPHVCSGVKSGVWGWKSPGKEPQY